jgi:hypothetical protein
MSDRNIFAEREHWLEEKYFRKRDEELIERLHRQRERQNEHLQMAEMIGVSEPNVIDALQDLGYTDKTVQLLYLVPLIQVAWSEGGVADLERDTILNIAETRGIEPGSGAQEQLINWLTIKPSEQFFRANLHAIRVVLESLPPQQRDLKRHDLIDSCNLIASIVEGGIMGRARISETERILIEHISTEIGMQ